MNFKNLTTECRDSLINAIETILDTRDKRYMFMRMEFKELVPMINLEGSPRETAWNIYCEFEKHSMLGSLTAVINAKFDAGIQLDIIIS